MNIQGKCCCKIIAKKNTWEIHKFAKWRKFVVLKNAQGGDLLIAAEGKATGSFQWICTGRKNSMDGVKVREALNC